MDWAAISLSRSAVSARPIGECTTLRESQNSSPVTTRISQNIRGLPLRVMPNRSTTGWFTPCIPPVTECQWVSTSCTAWFAASVAMAR